MFFYEKLNFFMCYVVSQAFKFSLHVSFIKFDLKVPKMRQMKSKLIQYIQEKRLPINVAMFINKCIAPGCAVSCHPKFLHFCQMGPVLKGSILHRIWDHFNMTATSQKRQNTNMIACTFPFSIQEKLELLFYVFKSLRPFFLSVQNKGGQLENNLQSTVWQSDKVSA